jgi:2-dehydro-3-deoxyphosphooctonate aldolase (KDO 8-P synthase)
MREFGYPVVFDSTHSVQLPGGLGTSSGGQRQFVSCLSRAATAVGIDALFLEVHHQPDDALCDASNMLDLDSLPLLLEQVKAIDSIVKEDGNSK